MKSIKWLQMSLLLFMSLNITAQLKTEKQDKIDFEKVVNTSWKERFSDTGTKDWTKKWFLDGEIAAVTTTKKGMQLTAGPQFYNNAHHMVLWTIDSFKGDLKIEFDFTRLDFENRGVNILYIQATGEGTDPYDKDIQKWSALRKVPAMSMYFEHMNSYHISFAAHPNKGENRDGYIRSRRYMPNKTGLKGTDLIPDYFPKELFEPGILHHVTVVKKDRNLYMKIQNSSQTYYCHFLNENLPIITEGRIGLRLMFSRSSLFSNIKVSERE